MPVVDRVCYDRAEENTRMDILPAGLEFHFRFSHDDRIGNYVDYHVRLDYRQPGGTITSHPHYERSWRITDTDRALESDVENRRRAEETAAFKEQIRRSIASEQKRLIINGESIVKV